MDEREQAEMELIHHVENCNTRLAQEECVEAAELEAVLEELSFNLAMDAW